MTSARSVNTAGPIFFTHAEQIDSTQLKLSELVENCKLAQRGYFSNTSLVPEFLCRQLANICGSRNHSLEQENLFYSEVKKLVDKAPSFTVTVEMKKSYLHSSLSGFFKPWEIYALSLTSKSLYDAKDPSQFAQALKNQGASTTSLAYTSSNKSWNEVKCPNTFNNFLLAQDLERKRFKSSLASSYSQKRFFNSLTTACLSFGASLISRFRPQG